MIGLLAGVALAHVPVVYLAGPDDDWCAVINGTIGNDIVMLEPGVYAGPCDIVAKPSDVAGEQTIVESLDPLDPPVLVAGDADYVLRVDGESVLLLQVAFADLPAGVDAVRIGDIGEAWVRACWFDRIAGSAVVQVGDVTGSLKVTDSELRDVGRAVDLGCDGACAAPWFELAENLVVGAGEGHHLGAGAVGKVVDEVVVGGGVAVTVQGGGLEAVELVGGLFESAGAALVLEQGPVRVDASVVVGAPAVAGAGEDVAEVRIVGSTLWGPLDLAGWGPDRGLELVGDAVLGEVPALPGVDLDGTVGCDASCFVDAEGWDFWPASGSPLRGAADGVDLGPDWCGRIRATPPSAGALEPFGDTSIGPLAPVFKEDLDCGLPEPPAGTTTEPRAEQTGEPRPVEEGCGCRAGSNAGSTALGWTALLLIGKLRSSRRR